MQKINNQLQCFTKKEGQQTMKSEHHRCAEMQKDSDDKVTFTETTQSMLTHYRYTARHTHIIIADKRTLRSSASGFGCPSSSSLCLISSSSSFSLFLSRSSASISFSRSLRRFCRALPLGVTPKITAFRTIATAAVMHLLLQIWVTKHLQRLYFHYVFTCLVFTCLSRIHNISDTEFKGCQKQRTSVNSSYLKATHQMQKLF